MAATSNKRKKAVAAVIAAAAILLAGTFAWTSISQIALNESAGIVNVGGRLHDDFNGENKDVYVENFTDPLNGGQPIYARIRLDEYMEVGPEAGDADNAGRRAEPVIAGTDINDVDTWIPHKPTTECEVCETSGTCVIHDHWVWEMGGETVFMPTFNKDKDSLKAEINGTYEGTTKGDTVYYDDYVTYKEGETISGDASYDDDTNTTDDGIVRTQEEEHVAKKTQKGTVITMNQWIADGKQPGNYWVYDTDGWAYWANPIMPGEATGLFLSNIDMKKNPGEKCYYGINVVGQFATVSDWEYFKDGGEPSTNALEVLTVASDNVPTVQLVNTTGTATLSPGDTVEFKATASVGGASTFAAGEFEWNVYNKDLSKATAAAITDNGDGTATLTVKEDAQPCELIVAARSTTYGGAVGTSSVAVVEPSLDASFETTNDLSGTPYAVLTQNSEDSEYYTVTFVRTEDSITPGTDELEGMSVVDAKVIDESYEWGSSILWNWRYEEDWYSGSVSGYKINNIVFANTIRPKATGQWFYGQEYLESITFTDKFDGSQLGYMDSMFNGCTNLKTIDMSAVDMQGARVSMDSLTSNCGALETFKAPKNASPTDMGSMFYCNYALKNVIGLETWDVSSCDDMSFAFYLCESIETLDLSTWETTGTTDMEATFGNMETLKTIDLSSFDMNGVTTMHQLFWGCEQLETITGAQDWDVSTVSDMYWCFKDCYKLDLDCSGWDAANASSNHDGFNDNAPDVKVPTVWQ